MEKIKIAIADDQLLFRKAIAEVIRDISDFELVADADNGQLLLDWLEATKQIPHIVLVDLDMPVMNGIQLNEQLHLLHPGVKVIILTVFNKERFISKMIDAGANGYLAKNCDIEELVIAIRTVYKTGFYFNNECIDAMMNAAIHRNKKLKNLNGIQIDITRREREVLLLICKEYTTTEISEKLFLSGRTVEGHRVSLLAKIGCKNAAGLVIYAIKCGLFEPGLS